MSYKREIPKLNRDNFSAWQELMRLHLATISDLGCKYLDEEYQTPTSTLLVGDIVERKNHNIMMIDIASARAMTNLMKLKIANQPTPCGKKSKKSIEETIM